MIGLIVYSGPCVPNQCKFSYPACQVSVWTLGRPILFKTDSWTLPVHSAPAQNRILNASFSLGPGQKNGLTHLTQAAGLLMLTVRCCATGAKGYDGQTSLRLYYDGQTALRLYSIFPTKVRNGKTHIPCLYYLFEMEVMSGLEMYFPFLNGQILYSVKTEFITQPNFIGKH